MNANSDDAKKLAISINNLLKNNDTVILDAHDYMQWAPNAQAGGGSFGSVVTTTQISYIWSSIISCLKKNGVDLNNQNLWFEISNEPGNSISSTNAYNLDIAGLQVIRDKKLNNKVLVEGIDRSSMGTWMASNAGAFENLNSNDPKKNVAIAMHQYFDADGSGTGHLCNAPKLNITGLTQWMHTNKIDIILDEFGTPEEDVTNCTPLVTNLLDQMKSSRTGGASTSSSATGLFLGWTVWNYSPVYAGVNFVTATGVNMENIYKQYLSPLSPSLSILNNWPRIAKKPNAATVIIYPCYAGENATNPTCTEITSGSTDSKFFTPPTSTEDNLRVNTFNDDPSKDALPVLSCNPNYNDNGGPDAPYPWPKVTSGDPLIQLTNPGQWTDPHDPKYPAIVQDNRYRNNWTIVPGIDTSTSTTATPVTAFYQADNFTARATNPYVSLIDDPTGYHAKTAMPRKNVSCKMYAYINGLDAGGTPLGYLVFKDHHLTTNSLLDLKARLDDYNKLNPGYNYSVSYDQPNNKLTFTKPSQ